VAATSTSELHQLAAFHLPTASADIHSITSRNLGSKRNRELSLDEWLDRAEQSRVDLQVSFGKGDMVRSCLASSISHSAILILHSLKLS